MTVSDPNDRERLDRIHDALEASLEEMSGEELRDEIRARGEDPDQVVREVRALLAEIAKEHRQAKLREARAGHVAAVRAFEKRTSRIPTDPARRRALYFEVAQTHKQFTLQQRDFEALPDHEVQQILELMDALGILPDDEP
jgi:hypothetical protein